MANSRLARFFMEVAPPQFVCVMRQRTSKMLDTIAEEDHRDGVFNEAFALSSSKLSSHCSSSSLLPAAAAAIVKPQVASSEPSSPSNYFITDVNRSFSIYGY